MAICLVCNTKVGTDRNNTSNVFNETKTLPSKTKLLDILSELLEFDLENKNCHVTGLCSKCYQACNNYDIYKSNMAILKRKIQDTYKATSDNNVTDKIKTIQPTIQSSPKKKVSAAFVVPASKLQPVPADYQLNLGKIAAVTVANSKAMAQKPLLNLKVTIGDSVLTQSLTTSTVKITKSSHDAQSEAIDIGDWNVESLLTHNDNNNENEDNDNVNEMEIDADCSLDQSQVESLDTSKIKIENGEFENGETQFIDAESLTYGNIQILGDGTDGQHTLVVDSNSSLLQMMAGQKLVYENGQLSLVMDNEEDDNGQDSNDEDSQIELQVSGDEETANAIIAAAQEQGGAFIKVESGEMYRVKSVQSTPAEPRDVAALLVAREGDEYRCLMCDNLQGSIKKSFVSKAQEMMSHMKSEHAAKVYICLLCGVVMRNRQDYYTHITEHQKKTNSPNKPRFYQCEVCRKSYNSRTLLQEHMNTHTGSRPHVCHICNKAFASKYTRQAHLKTHQSRPRPFKCQECGKQFLSLQNLNQHQKTHLGIKNFVCNICNKAFGTQHNLEVHGIVHSGTKSHVCDVCSKAFARRAELVDHIRIHTGERPFSCEVCGARFSQRSNLHSHKRATHYDQKPHACEHCSKRFKRRRLLQYHIKAAHTGERPLSCDLCQSTFVYPEHYKKHIKIHSGDRPYDCEICGKSFSSRDNRNTHRFVHSDKKPYECLACGASFMRKRTLVQHMEANGHLAESIVVNQPRVTKVSNDASVVPDSGAEIRLLYEDNEGEDKLEEEIEEEDSKDCLDTKLYTINVNTDGSEDVEHAALTASLHSEQLATEMTDENGDVLRLIQVKMSDGNSGWVALNN